DLRDSPPNDVVRSSAKKGAQPPPFSPVVPQAVMSPSEPHRAAEGKLKLYLQTASNKDSGGTCLGGSNVYSWRHYEEDVPSVEKTYLPTTDRSLKKGGILKKRVQIGAACRHQ
ncbi:hypothetical protein THAOC_27338, partial [Thalassiosira oceanica]